jgi:hypothetical protein
MRKKVVEEEIVEESGFRFKWWLVGVVVLVLVSFVFLFGYEECGDSECFFEAMKVCDRVKFVGGDDMIFEYKILGRDGDFCKVNVKLLQANLNAGDSVKLEGEEMECFLEKGVVVAPESDIGVCHGRLKEELQGLIIERMQGYLLENLGQLNYEMLSGEFEV